MQRRTGSRPLGYARVVAGMPIEQILLLLSPLIVIQLGLMLFALIDLQKDERHVRGGNKVVWALIVIFVNIIGPILYFVAGREEET